MAVSGGTKISENLLQTKREYAIVNHISKRNAERFSEGLSVGKVSEFIL